jgi:hypothetical protein
MVHSIELLFDDHVETVLRGQCAALAEAGLPGPAGVAAVGRPHVTLVVAARIEHAADENLARLAARLPLECTVGAPVLFGSGRYVLARLVTASRELLDLHAAVYGVSEPHMAPHPMPHTAPGHWTPHTTLCRRLSATDAGRALAAVRGLGHDLTGRCVALRHWDGERRTEHVLG